MGRASVDRRKNLSCPSCGSWIDFRRGKDRVGVCPDCGEWLSQSGWPRRRLELIPRELPGSAFDESDEWERTLLDEIR